MWQPQLRELGRIETHFGHARTRASRPCAAARPRSWRRCVACAALLPRFSIGTRMTMSAESMRGSGSLVMTCGSSMRRSRRRQPARRSCQMPLLRSRMAGIQSQPSVATNVGPSMARLPPFSPGPAATDCSCGIPGCGGGDTRTASTLAHPGVRARCHIEAAANESAADGAQTHAIEPNLGRIVDAVEGQRQLPAGERCAAARIRCDTNNPADSATPEWRGC